MGGGSGTGAGGWGGVSKPGGHPGVCTGGFGDLVLGSGTGKTGRGGSKTCLFCWVTGEVISDTDASEEAMVDDDAEEEAKELFGPLKFVKATDVLGPLKVAVVVTDWKVGVGVLSYRPRVMEGW